MPHGSLTAWAQHCGWTLRALPGEPAQPNKSLAQRVMHRLEASKLVHKNGRTYTLTKSGMEAARNPTASAT
jgi:hypothetical protein